HESVSGRNHHYGQCDHPVEGARGGPVFRSAASAVSSVREIRYQSKGEGYGVRVEIPFANGGSRSSRKGAAVSAASRTMAGGKYLPGYFTHRSRQSNRFSDAAAVDYRSIRSGRNGSACTRGVGEHARGVRAGVLRRNHLRALGEGAHEAGAAWLGFESLQRVLGCHELLRASRGLAT